MGKWMRRIRSAAVVGLTWAVAWFGAGMALLLVIGPNAADVPFPLFFGLLGFLSGASFSAILGVVARHRSFEELRLPRVAGWGALGGLLIAGLVTVMAGPGGEVLVVAPVFAAAGALSAAGTLALARRASGQALSDGTIDAIDAAADDARPRLP